MNPIGLEIGRRGEHEAQGMVEGGTVGRIVGAFESPRCNFHPPGSVRQKPNRGPQIDGKIERAGRKVPQRVIKNGQIEGAAHVHPTRRRCHYRIDIKGFSQVGLHQ